MTTNFTYNGDGLRVGKSVSGGSSNSMVWNVALGLPQVISDSTYVYIYGLGSIGMVDAQGNAYYFLRDELGSVTGITDATGALIADYSYDAFGNLKSSNGTLPNSLLYTGQWSDSETGLYYLRARYYDPEVDSFIAQVAEQMPTAIVGGGRIFQMEHLVEKKAVVDSKECVGCSLCTWVCAKTAIRMVEI